MRLFWHRRDLRTADNVGLTRAATDDSVVPVFVLDPDVLAHAGPPRVAFLLDALAALRADYRELGGDLVVARGDPTAVLPELATHRDADGVTWNRDYSGLARERDAAVRDALAAAGFDVAAHHDALCHEPGSILTSTGETYSVFSYFWRKWRDRDKEPPVDPPGADSLVSPDSDPGPIPDTDAMGVDGPEADVPTTPKADGTATPRAGIPPASTAAARERLDDFCADDVYRYAEARDYPAEEATSRLSVHLKFGTLGPREVWAATADAHSTATDDDAPGDGDGDDARESVRAFQRQLAWREFYTHVLATRPDVVADDYKDFENAIEWRDDPAGLQAWKDGETGYPLVDAGMRQLRAEAWMHNRARMVVASFLTKDLLVDWRAGYDWFREKLVDHDPANDSGGWQWAAGTGTDAQPYFRVFNPATQCERFDPDGEYVTRYVPELRDATPRQIHDWPDLSADERESAAPEYPAPIVDHAERREAAIETFERARGN